MPPDFDMLVVGAGVIGLAIAREASHAGKNVLVLEQGPRAGLDTSSRNSEVIHAGIYYPQGSLKARLCFEGRQLLYDYCASHGVDAKPVGKLIVATSTEEEARLQSIQHLAAANGVNDLEWLTPEDVAGLEPEVCCTRAVLSPSTGIIDATRLMQSLQGDAQSSGASFAFNTRFKSMKRRDGRYIAKASDAAGNITDVTCRQVFNCAGHGAHAVARAVEYYPSAVLPPRFLAKGSYCSVSGKNPFRHLVYPVPVNGALGIHATIDCGGAIRLGPDISWVDNVDYNLPDGLPEKFSSAVQSYWPGVCDRELTPNYCGVRPKIHGPDAAFADFEIQSITTHGLPGLYNFFGIESPGLTASLAIAKFTLRHSQNKDIH